MAIGVARKTSEAFRGDYCTVGDFARRDEEGYVYLVDRKSNMIISGGENVYPSEVEALLSAHPKVKDVAVIGLADGKWGERVHAVIVPHDGKRRREAEIIDWCRRPDRRLQTAALGVVHSRRRDAEDGDGKDPAPVLRMQLTMRTQRG